MGNKLFRRKDKVVVTENVTPMNEQTLVEAFRDDQELRKDKGVVMQTLVEPFQDHRELLVISEDEVILGDAWGPRQLASQFDNTDPPQIDEMPARLDANVKQNKRSMFTFAGRKSSHAKRKSRATSVTRSLSMQAAKYVINKIDDVEGQLQEDAALELRNILRRSPGAPKKTGAVSTASPDMLEENLDFVLIQAIRDGRAKERLICKPQEIEAGDGQLRRSVLGQQDRSSRRSSVRRNSTVVNHNNQVESIMETTGVFVSTTPQFRLLPEQYPKHFGTWQLKGNTLVLNWGNGGEYETAKAVSKRQFINKSRKSTFDILEPSTTPEWFMPRLSGASSSLLHISASKFECPICFGPLWRYPRCVIRYAMRRPCTHYFHTDCIKWYIERSNEAEKHCPICAVAFTDFRVLPDMLKSPKEWFGLVDADMSGSLDREEIINALGCVLPVERMKITKWVNTNWAKWDPNNDGTIDIDEFSIPKTGMRDMVIDALPKFRSKSYSKITKVPNIETNPRDWFEYWDMDKNGFFELEEVIRALDYTFCHFAGGVPNLKLAQETREIITSLWDTFEYDRLAGIDFEEFVKPYGLMDSFIHNFAHTKHFGDDLELTEAM